MHTVSTYPCQCQRYRGTNINSAIVGLYNEPQAMRNTAKYLNPTNLTVNNNTYPTAEIQQSKLIHLPRSLIRSLHHATRTIPTKLLARGGTNINAFPGISTNPICVSIPGIKYTNERFGMRMHMYRRA